MREFNLNDHVYVRLTEAGLRYHREDYDRIWENYPAPLVEYRPPRMVDGWHEFQLWDFMRLYGPHVEGQHDKAPFEKFLIRIPEQDAEERLLPVDQWVKAARSDVLYRTLVDGCFRGPVDLARFLLRTTPLDPEPRSPDPAPGSTPPG